MKRKKKRVYRHRVSVRRSYARYRWRSFGQGLLTWMVRFFFVSLSLWLGATAYAFWKESPWMRVQNVIFEGPVTPKIKRRLGIEMGDHLFQFSEKEKVLQFSNEFPEISNLKLHRGWNRNVYISFEKRRPIAKIYNNKNWIGVDSTGTFFPMSNEEASSKKLIILAGVEEGEKALPALTFVKYLEGLLTPWTQRLYKIKLIEEEVLLFLKDSVTIYWGELSLAEKKLKLKVQRLERVFEDPKLASGVEYIRFVKDNRLAVMPRKEK